MTGRYQGHEMNRVQTNSKHTTKRKQTKSHKEKVLSLGFVSASIVVAIVCFFVCLTIGMQIAPNLSI